MNILAFDTCFGACSVAVGIDVGLPSERLEEFFEPRDVGHAEALMPMINSAMTGAGIGFDKLDRIAVTHGPGSFTGTRIGVSAARALHVATGVPLVSASSLAVMAEEAADSLRDEMGAMLLGVAVDARKDQVYVQWFAGSGLKPLTAPAVVSPVEAVALTAARDLVVVGSGGEAVARAAASVGRTATNRLPRLQPDACALVFMARELPLTDRLVEPLYLREADAKPPADPALPRK